MPVPSEKVPAPTTTCGCARFAAAVSALPIVSLGAAAVPGFELLPLAATNTALRT